MDAHSGLSYASPLRSGGLSLMAHCGPAGGTWPETAAAARPVSGSAWSSSSSVPGSTPRRRRCFSIRRMVCASTAPTSLVLRCPSPSPATLDREATLALGEDPIAFVLDRKTSFYATDFERLLGSLPWYRPGARVGTLLAIPVLSGEVVLGVLVADRSEIQAFTGSEPELLESFARLVADDLSRTRAAVSSAEQRWSWARSPRCRPSSPSRSSGAACTGCC